MRENTVRDIIAESVKRQVFSGMVGSYSWNVDVDTDEIDEEGEEGYVDECAARDEWMNEVVNFNLEMLKIAGVFKDAKG